MSSCKVSFEEVGKDVLVENGTVLSECLDAVNSPVLFGCRTGICGTCLVEVITGTENLNPASDDENEFLDILDKKEKHRLACQLSCQGDVKLKYIGKGRK